MTYTEAKKEIDKIRNEYGCAGDLIFRTAIMNVIEYGKDSLNMNEDLEQWLDDIDEKHNMAEASGKHLIMTREFEKAIAECTFKLAQIDTMSFIMYLQREIWMQDIVGEIEYKRAIYLLKSVIEFEIADTYETEAALNELYEMDFRDDELEELGYGYLLDMEEE